MTELSGYARYAIYYAPEPGSALARTGAAWLGVDPAGAPPPPLEVPGLPRPREELVARAARYGLHATLKAPFRLAAGATAADLAQALDRLAASTSPAEAPGLALDADLGFVALRPAGPCPAVDALAAACVTELDALRAPLTAGETAAKTKPGLDPSEAAHLARWGYPYVLDRFRFHITLTSFLPPDQARAATTALTPPFAPALAPVFRIDALSLFGDPGGGRPFRLLGQWQLTDG
jgi:hypothetical protein